ncbi:unnamed protein product, partial [Larinioides sclopetarius]
MLQLLEDSSIRVDQPYEKEVIYILTTEAEGYSDGDSVLH